MGNAGMYKVKFLDGQYTDTIEAVTVTEENFQQTEWYPATFNCERDGGYSITYDDNLHILQEERKFRVWQLIIPKEGVRRPDIYKDVRSTLQKRLLSYLQTILGGQNERFQDLRDIPAKDVVEHV